MSRKKSNDDKNVFVSIRISGLKQIIEELMGRINK